MCSCATKSFLHSSDCSLIRSKFIDPLDPILLRARSVAESQQIFYCESLTKDFRRFIKQLGPDWSMSAELDGELTVVLKNGSAVIFRPILMREARVSLVGL